MKTTAKKIDDATFLEIWIANLETAALHLDLADAEDRVIYRLNVADQTRNLKVTWIRKLAVYFGGEHVPTSRSGAVKALCAAYKGIER